MEQVDVEYGELRMSSVGAGDSVRFSTYITDSNGRLSRIIDSNNRRTELFFTDLNYDASGRVAGYKLTNTYGVAPEEFSFEYDASGHIVRQFHITPSGAYVRCSYTYDAQGRLVSDGHYQYTYDQNDDVVEVSDGTRKQVISYSKTLNPFAGFDKIQFYLVRQNPQVYYQEYLFLSKHQPTSLTKTSGTPITYFDLEMLKPDLLGSYKTSWGPPSPFPVETVFYYKELNKL